MYSFIYKIKLIIIIIDSYTLCSSCYSHARYIMKMLIMAVAHRIQSRNKHDYVIDISIDSSIFPNLYFIIFFYKINTNENRMTDNMVMNSDRITSALVVTTIWARFILKTQLKLIKMWLFNYKIKKTVRILSWRQTVNNSITVLL